MLGAEGGDPGSAPINQDGGSGGGGTCDAGAINQGGVLGAEGDRLGIDSALSWCRKRELSLTGDLCRLLRNFRS